MRTKKRNILLLLDNASSHKPGDLHLTNVKIHMLPPNTTPVLQPMDAGIIAALKLNYREKQMDRAVDLIEEDEDYEGDTYAVDQLQAMKWCEEVWDHISEATIAHWFGNHVSSLL